MPPFYTINTNVDQTARAAAGFEADPSGYAGFVLRDGVLDDASAIVVAEDGGDPTIFTVSGLPLVGDSVYILTFTLLGANYVYYYAANPAAFYPERLIPFRETGETLASMDVKLFRNQVEQIGVLSPVAEVSGVGYLVSGWPKEPDSYSLTWDVGGSSGAYEFTVFGTTTVDLAPETVERRLLVKHVRTELLGPLFDQTEHFPVAIPGVSFDETKAADVAPFTVAQVRDDVGFADLYLREVDTFDSNASSGVNAAGVMETSRLTSTRCRFILAVPGRRADVQAKLEDHTETILQLMTGLVIHHDGPPEITLRQLTRDPPRVWEDNDSGDWRRRTVDVLIERRYRRIHQGLTEVTI